MRLACIATIEAYRPLPESAIDVSLFFQPFYNRYGLFVIITKHRQQFLMGIGRLEP
ncbi:Uncharacterised protein [Neisseria gonorrhoeae]|uniref:Uncharacterized protein n=1 Tax=Neisseria gonorrhoeae TaxID=485 RepID=A0A378VUS8_NEIGO|nr:Uncharacterised protein [Neisseria gonorrhoeae]